MHDTSAPEATHRYNIKTAMDRVRKSDESETSKSLISWNFRVRTWAKIVDAVEEHVVTGSTRKTRVPASMEIILTDRNRLVPADNMVPRLSTGTFSPLRRGADNLLCNDARLSYMELGTLISRYTGWDIGLVLDTIQVRLYCSARVLHSSGEKRSYWSTESRYNYMGGYRRDKVEINLGPGRIGVGEITAFIQLSGIDGQVIKGVIIRWMSKSSLSTQTDGVDRPLCEYPLSFNHYLWEWSDAGSNRDCFRIRGFRNAVTRQNLWSHVPDDDRQLAIDSELRARYDIVDFDSIKRHVNIFEDPSTHHMLQTLQIV